MWINLHNIYLSDIPINEYEEVIMNIQRNILVFLFFFIFGFTPVYAKKPLIVGEVLPYATETAINYLS